LNTCRGFVGPSQALCQVQVALSLISPWSIGWTIPTWKPKWLIPWIITSLQATLEA